MNEVEFVARRIIKQAQEWAEIDYNQQLKTGISRPNSMLRYEANRALINHLIKEFLGKGNNDSN